MPAASQLGVAPVAVSIENAGDWEAIARQAEAKAGVPTTVTPEILTATVASAVPLLFEADARGEAELLRGTFTDAVIAQRAQNAGGLEGARPLEVTLRLVGVHAEQGHAVLRVHLAIRVEDTAGTEHPRSEFWDLQLGGQAVVGASCCPNCGAPVAAGHLICSHCQSDVRGTVAVPLVVSRVELY